LDNSCSADWLGSSLEVVANRLGQSFIERPDDAELQADRIPHDDPVARLIGLRRIDHRGPQCGQSIDLGVEIVGEDVKVTWADPLPTS
jgi:hypothetical protein